MTKPLPFITPFDHFNRMVEALPAGDLDLYREMRCTRVITGYPDRTLVAYDVNARGEVMMLDVLHIEDVEITSEIGASIEITSDRTGESVIVRYAPIRLFNMDIFAWLPLHLKVNWDAIPDQDGKIDRYSMGFNMCLRTHSRRHALETGTHHCETGRDFRFSFPDIAIEI